MNSELKLFLVAHQFTEFSKLVKAVTRVEQEKKQEQNRKQKKRSFSGKQDTTGQKRPRDRQASVGFSSRPERGGYSRSGSQRQQGTGSSVPVGFSRVLRPAECVHCGQNQLVGE